MRALISARLLLGLAALALACAAPSRAAETKSFSPDQSREIERIVRDYLVSHPEVIAEAIDALQKREDAKAAEAAKAEIAAARGELLNAPDDIVVGNPKGDVTMVEFFDYRCGYCKKAVDQVEAAIKADPKLRVVMKSYPILGPDSVVAARAVFAAKVQGADKQSALHKALMAAKNPIDEAKVVSLAKEAGLDTDRLKVDMKDGRIDAVIEKNRALGTRLGVNGTPFFLIGDKLISGVETADNLKAAIEAARKAS